MILVKSLDDPGGMARKGRAAGIALLAGACFLLMLGVAAAFVTSAGAHLGGAAASVGSATFTDPRGDATGPAPDVTTVLVSDDPTTGTITINLTGVGYGTARPDTYPMVKVYLNTDRNVTTGALDQLGAEYYVGARQDPTGSYWFFASWDGSKYTSVAQSPTMSFRRSGDAMTWTFNRSDIGGSTAFAFFAWSSTWDANNNKTGEDSAPDYGTWTYDSASGGSPTTTTTTPSPRPTPPKVALLVDTPKTAPAQAVAGKPFTVTFAVHFQKEEQVTSIDISTGQTKTALMVSWLPVPTGKMVCDPSVAGKVIAHVESFKNSLARLSFVIPKTAKAKLLRVSVKITATEKKTGRTVSAIKIATFRVR